MQRQELVKVYKDTQRLARQTTSHNYKQSQKWNIDTDLPDDEDLFDDAADQKRDRPALVNVVNADTLTTAIDHLVNDNLNPLVLNMASDFCPGGGVAKGCRAQEEQLFRCTNYCWCTNNNLYPIKDNEFIITDDVQVIKDENYNILRDYYQFDFIAVAAVRKPLLTYNDGQAQYMKKEDQHKMQAKIDAIFRYAIYQEKDSLVLGALGCGAFGNPPEQVCDMFQKAINKYRNYFDQITFAVLSDEGNPNYNIFKQLRASQW